MIPTQYQEAVQFVTDDPLVLALANEISAPNGWDNIKDDKAAASCLSYRGDDAYYLVHADDEKYFGGRYLGIKMTGVREEPGLEGWIWMMIQEKFGGMPRLHQPITWN